MKIDVGNYAAKCEAHADSPPKYGRHGNQRRDPYDDDHPLNSFQRSRVEVFTRVLRSDAHQKILTAEFAETATRAEEISQALAALCSGPNKFYKSGNDAE